MDYFFYAALTLSSLFFVVIWTVHMISLLRNRARLRKLDYGRIVIWTVVPILMLASISVFGWQIVDNLQKTLAFFGTV